MNRVKEIQEKLNRMETLLAEIRGMLEESPKPVQESSVTPAENPPMSSPETLSVNVATPAEVPAENTAVAPVRRPKLVNERVEGVFNGKEVITEFDEVVPIPVGLIVANTLTVGDKLRLDYSGGDDPVIKVVEKIKRRGIEGVLKYENGNWRAETREGKYQVLPEFVSLYGLKDGERVSVFLPRSFKGKVNFAVAEKYRDMAPPERERSQFREGPRRERDGDRPPRRDDRSRDERLPRREEAPAADSPERILDEEDLR